MKTFKQFILEDNSPDLKDFLQKNCKNFLSKIRSNPDTLTRGIESIPSRVSKFNIFANDSDFQAFTADVRKDRKPLSISDDKHTIINNWFFDNFGIYHRSQSLFCFGGIKNKTTGTYIYGPIKCLIFPIGDFSYVWSPNIADLFGDLGSAQSEEQILDLLEEAKYKNNDFAGALASKNEIMINCDSYLAVVIPKFEDGRKILKYIESEVL